MAVHSPPRPSRRLLTDPNFSRAPKALTGGFDWSATAARYSINVDTRFFRNRQ